MPRIISRRLTWAPSPSLDVVGYRVYVFPGEYRLQLGVGGNEEDVFESEFHFLSGREVDHAELNLIVDEEGRFSFIVGAVDNTGNESLYQAEVWVNVPLDMTPPVPVSNGGIE